MDPKRLEFPQESPSGIMKAYKALRVARGGKCLPEERLTGDLAEETGANKTLHLARLLDYAYFLPSI